MSDGQWRVLGLLLLLVLLEAIKQPTIVSGFKNFGFLGG